MENSLFRQRLEKISKFWEVLSDLVVYDVVEVLNVLNFVINFVASVSESHREVGIL